MSTIFTALLNKARNKGLELGGRVSFREYDVARATARAIRIFAPKDGIVYLDNYEAQLLYRIGDAAYKYGVQLAIEQPGGGFRQYRVDLEKLHEALKK